MTEGRRKVAIVLFNLGGPDGPGEVRSFLENLFSDPAIIKAPGFVRIPLAMMISRMREKSAIANYAVMGGGSPILPETLSQARALQDLLVKRRPDLLPKTFIAMRYSEPSIATAAEEVGLFDPDEVVLAPLYPQFSTTTTGSSFRVWDAVYAGAYRGICCWHENRGLILAHAQAIRSVWDSAGRPHVRLLFSAHGLPESIAADGDPYQRQVENTCAKVAQELGPGWDWRICYQSKVGPMKWLGPTTPAEIRSAGTAGIGVIIDPIAFVSEHIETLVELDRDYAEVATQAGAPVYLRVPAMGIMTPFIDGLADAIESALLRDGLKPDGSACAQSCYRCPIKGRPDAI